MTCAAMLDVEQSDLTTLERRVDALEKTVAKLPDPDSISLVVFSNEMDRLLAAFVMATGAAACGQNVVMFFTFWATSALRKHSSSKNQKSLVERLFGWMLPKGHHQAKLSRMDFWGVGRALMSREMRLKNIANLDKLISTAADLGVKIQVCEMSMKLMGIRQEEFIDYPNLEFCGVASFSARCSEANTTLFI